MDYPSQPDFNSISFCTGKRENIVPQVADCEILEAPLPISQIMNATYQHLRPTSCVFISCVNHQHLLGQGCSIICSIFKRKRQRPKCTLCAEPTAGAITLKPKWGMKLVEEVFPTAQGHLQSSTISQFTVFVYANP